MPATNKVVFVPPSDKAIEQCAHAICRALGEQINPAYNTSEVRNGFAEFIKITARIQAKHLTDHTPPRDVTGSAV